MSLTVNALRFSRGSRVILHDISLSVEAGQVCVVMGPNGAGKSTLLSIIAGDLHPESGTVCFRGQAMADIHREELAKIRGYYLQNAGIRSEIRVEEVVERGRIPYQPRERREESRNIASHILGSQGLGHLSPRIFRQLSGGEQQRVQFARVLSQLWQRDGCLVLLDEPSSNLDVKHQLGLLSQARSLAENGATVIMAVHDLNLGARIADRALVLKDGRVLASGPATQVFRTDVFERAFDIPFVEIAHADAALPFFTPLMPASATGTATEYTQLTTTEGVQI